MKTVNFNYELPQELIAQHPYQRRDESRLMVVKRSSGEIEEYIFKEIPRFFRQGDILVVNDSRVIPARIAGVKEPAVVVELFLLRKQTAAQYAWREVWVVLLKPARRLKEGVIINLPDGGRAEILARLSDKKWMVEFFVSGEWDDFINEHGTVPLPPYIKRSSDDAFLGVVDKERYQTVYARSAGSVAAPTAGLHFTPELLAEVQQNGVTIAPVTLHVGYGTFAPIVAENIDEHVMEQEYFEITAATAKTVTTASRIIAVGSTSCRVIESIASADKLIEAQAGFTDIFIRPGYEFKKVDCLLTNFHLPSSTLFVLVCAFAGEDLMRESYHLAIEKKYRFYSYGDCMLIL